MNCRRWLDLPAGLAVVLLVACAGAAYGANPVVKTVPWVATNSLIPHDTFASESIYLKGTVTNLTAGHNYTWTWDFGDGTPVATGAVTDPYVIQAAHTYAGAVGQLFTASLSVQDNGTGEKGTGFYFVQMRAKTLQVEVNVAIDQGLWYLHKTMARSADGQGLKGQWNSGNAASGWAAIWALNVNAFESNGHLETGDPNNPYTETVQRGLRRLMDYLTCQAIALQTNPEGTFNPDGNGNGLGCYENQGYQIYQGGPLIDAIVASGTPNMIATSGGANIIGRTYKAIVQDMVDYFAYCQYDSGTAAGGWRYGCNEYPDNSACQWAAIGMIPAEREWGIMVPQALKLATKNHWLAYTQDGSGGFGYTDPGYYPWGPYAVTPSGMVQMVWVGVGRGSVGAPSWDKAETYIRNNFNNAGGAGSSIKNYYYGLFSFVKSMLLHDSNGDGIAEPITMLQSSTPGVLPIDWYGDATNGVARKLINDQVADGYWYGHNYTGDQYPMETGMALIMLNKTIFTAGQPVAVATATPNPAVVGATITLDGSAAFHQDAARKIVKWEWDLNGDGIVDQTGPVITTSYPALGNYPAKLIVTDDSAPPRTAETIVTVVVSIPPLAPTANAGGPYSFCPGATPWRLDGRKSINPDDGKSEPGKPGDFIKAYAWDLNGSGQFLGATGPTPDVTAFYTGVGPGSYLAQLRVTDNTAASFPSSGQPDLTSIASAQVYVRSATAPECASCPKDVKVYPKITKVEVYWTYRAGALGYNVYRSATPGGPYTYVGNAKVGLFVDTKNLVLNTTYYYVIREVLANTNELCQSNEASGKLVGR
jgi:hypothetical protein